MRLGAPFSGDLVFQTPADLHVVERDDVVIVIDPARPNWLTTDTRGWWILRAFDGTRDVDGVTRAYAEAFGVALAKASVHVLDLLAAARRADFVSLDAPEERPYQGRAQHRPPHLEELWLHVNDRCNLECAHCLVSSGPHGSDGMALDDLFSVIREAAGLGARRFFITGGEPLVRKDIVSLGEEVLKHGELVLLTNGTLLRGPVLDALAALHARSDGRLSLQVSLDGPDAATNDAVRGTGSFHNVTAGIKNATRRGLRVSVATVVMPHNSHRIPETIRVAAGVGSTSHHLMWLHRHGRAADGAWEMSDDACVRILREAAEAAADVGVTLDNAEALAGRVNQPPGTRFDLGGAAYTTLCVAADGTVYPSAALVGEPDARMGNLFEYNDVNGAVPKTQHADTRSIDPDDAGRNPAGGAARGASGTMLVNAPSNVSAGALGALWSQSSVAHRFRSATVVTKSQCASCHLRFLCGGGDIEHAFHHARANDGMGDPMAQDPYCGLHMESVYDAMLALSKPAADQRAQDRSGYDAPRVLHHMGQNGVLCGDDDALPDETHVEIVPSNCVLKFEVDRYRSLVRTFYGQAAEEPDQELCCPIDYDADDLAHIPEATRERMYGCGSPIGLADLQEGETHVDLGSGAGIDCFIAAKRVGARGQVIGIDMTESMLAVANESRLTVARSLGYDNVTFRKGYLEDVPVASDSADLVTSNCVVNLSPDKRTVFAEAWRILGTGGRLVLSDIVSEHDVPPHMRVDERLWGACLAGALSEDVLLDALQEAGFVGVQVLSRTFWKEVEGHRFWSVTVRAYKHPKSAACVYQGQTATYLGPLKQVIDDEGHLFPRGVPVTVCTDTAAILRGPAFADQFLVRDSAEDTAPYACCTPRDGPCCSPTFRVNLKA